MQRIIDPYTLGREFRSVIGEKRRRVNRLVTELWYSFTHPRSFWTRSLELHIDQTIVLTCDCKRLLPICRWSGGWLGFI